MRDAIKRGGLRPARSLGQNFLTDRDVARRIVDAAQLTRDDFVVEVGPGVCALTGLICEAAGSVTAIEIDKHLVGRIRDAMADYSNFKLVNADILKVDPSEFIPAGVRKIKLISNLPYYISTAIMMRFFERYPIVSRAVLTMQREVADRLIARPSTKAYGALTVAVNFHAKPKRLFTIPPHCFVPQPAVESAVVTLDARDEPPVTVIDHEMFFRVVHAAFAQRRKTLANNLICSGLARSREEAETLLVEAGINTGARGETLDIESFAKLSRVIGRKI